MKMAPPDDQIFYQSKLCHLLAKIATICKWCHLLAKFATNAIGAIWWPNLQGAIILLLNLIQVTESISGSVVPLAMFLEKI